MKKLIIGLVAILLGVTLTWAAVPEKISFQGRITGATSPVNLTFKLWNAETGGSQVGTNIAANGVVLDNSGVFSTSLEVTGIPFDQPYWLETIVGTTPLTPRQPLTAAPYALMARSLPGVTSGATLDVTGDINFGGNLYNNNTQIMLGGGADGTGGWTEDTANNKIYATNTSRNVGIGTTAPNVNAKLQVKPSVDISTVPAGPFTGDSSFFVYGQNGKIAISAADDAGNQGHDLLINAGAGNVGIGTVDPAQKLHVSGPGARLRIENTSASNNPVLEFLTNPSGASSKDAFVFQDGASGNLFIRTDTAGEHVILQANRPGETWSQGNVGLGTTAPGEKLTVAGTIETTTGGVKFPDGFIQTVAYTGQGGGGASGWTAEATKTTTLLNVGIGTAAPGTYKLKVAGNVSIGGSLEVGSFTEANGQSSTALGSNVVASGGRSLAMGYNSTASGLTSIAMGSSTTASGDRSIAMGSNISVSGRNSFGIGLDDTISKTVPYANTLAILGGNVGIGTAGPFPGGYSLNIKRTGSPAGIVLQSGKDWILGSQIDGGFSIAGLDESPAVQIDGFNNVGIGTLGTGTTKMVVADSSGLLSTQALPTSYTAGTGLSLVGTAFSAQNTTALWNANQLQGKAVSTTQPTIVGQVLRYSGTNWEPYSLGLASLAYKSTIADTDVATNAAIAGTKISPNFGSQDVWTTGELGIGGVPGAHKLFVEGTPLNTFGDNRSLLYLKDSSSYGPGVGGGIGFGGYYGAGATDATQWAGIKGLKENSTVQDYSGALVFSTRINGSLMSEKMRISSAGNVGIRTAATGARLNISGGDGTTGITLNGATIALGYDTTGYMPHFIQTNHNSSGPTLNAINFYTSDGTSNGVFPTNAVHGMTIENGKVGVGTGMTNPSHVLDVAGDMQVTGNIFLPNLPWGAGNSTYYVSYNNSTGLLGYSSTTSSIKYKKDVRGLDIDMNKVMELKPRAFRWKSDNSEDVGFIAEEVNEIIPQLVGFDKDGQPESVKYDKVAVYLLGVVKEQQKEIESQKVKNQELEGRIRGIEARLGKN
jgi:hypothetical protein